MHRTDDVCLSSCWFVSFGGTGYRRPELATGTSGEIAFKENLIPHCAPA